MWYDGYFQIHTGTGTIGKLNRSKLAKFKNLEAFQNAFSRMITDALMRYKFEGLPDTMSERVILQSLLWYGSVVLFEKNGGLYALPGVPSGDGFNVYGDPGKAWVFGYNGQMNEEVTLHIPGGDDSAFLEIMTSMRKVGRGHGVLLWENALKFPFISQVIFYARSVADSYRMLDVMRANLKRPYIVVAEESVVPTVKKFFENRDENDDIIVDSGVFPVDKISLLPFDTQSQNLKDCTEIIEWYESKFRELCGVDSNAQIDKKGENLISDEIHVNDNFEALQVEKCVEYIQRGLDIFNKFYNTNIRCVVRKEEQVNENNNDIRRGESDNAGISDDDRG